MASVSRFSTPETFAQVEDAIATLQQAITEAQTAVRAGVPGAQQVLDNANAALKRVETFKGVYFPNGAPQPQA